MPKCLAGVMTDCIVVVVKEYYLSGLVRFFEEGFREQGSSSAMVVSCDVPLMNERHPMRRNNATNIMEKDKRNDVWLEHFLYTQSQLQLF